MRNIKQALLLVFAIAWGTLPLQADDYPVGSLIKLANTVTAYNPEDMQTAIGRLPAGGLLKVTSNKGDGWVQALYKSPKRPKPLPVAILTAGLEGSAVKKPRTPYKPPAPSQPVSKPKRTTPAYRLTPDTLRALAQTRGTEFTTVNEALGNELWRDDNLWDDDIGDIAGRLGWPRESETETQRSYRLYARENVRVLGARPFSLALYGTRELPTYFSMIFANKGDIDVLPKSLEASMEEDKGEIERRLTEALGKPRTQIFGQGNMKDRVQRWDWENHAIMLASPEGEYVGVRILPSGAADAEGKGMKVRDAEMKAMLAERIVKRDNGDCLVSQIPMVDQGPKGYCVPATWERYLRYMEIPADMYMLAMAGETQAGGGTSITKMIDATKNLVLRYGRKLKDVKSEFSIQHIRSHIDQGIPLIWIMNSGPKYNEAVNTYTKDRKAAEWEAWKETLPQRRRGMAGAVRDDGGHACMIVGYNAETRELAVSDSWGARFEERWIPIEAAAAATQDQLGYQSSPLFIIRW